MARVSTKDLAKALYLLTADKKKGEIESVLKDLVAYLGKRQILHKSPQIIEQFRQFYNKEAGEIDVIIRSRFPLTDSQLSGIVKKIEERFPKKELNIVSEIDKKMLGGVKVHIEDLILDYSLDGKLQQLQTYLINKI